MRNLLAFMAMLPCTLLSQPPDYVADNGLMIWYSMDGSGSNAVNSQFNLNLGNISFGADRFGNPESALWLTTDDQMATTSIFEFPASEFSVALWCKLETPFTYGAYSWVEYGQQLIGQSGSSGWNVGIDSANLYTHYFYTSESAGGCASAGGPISPAEAGEWHHLVAVHDGISNKFYFNGTLIVSVACNGSSNFNFVNNELRIGNRDNASPGAQRLVDEFGLWNRALDSAEVVALYIGTPPEYGCTDSSACNFDAEATVDDGSCLPNPVLDLAECLIVTETGEVALTVPEGLSSFIWEDGSSAPVRPIGIGGEFILNATVGDLPSYGTPLEDGLVFHIDTVNLEIYIATPTQLGDGAEFGCKGTVTGAWGTEIGDGIANTEAILAACADPTSAASVASNVGPGWFLPSQAELDAIRTRLHDTGFGSYFTDNVHNWYWPSTECEASPANAAGSMHFINGFYGACNNKDSNPGGVVAAKRIPLDLCFVSDTLYIAPPCTLSTDEPACGEGTVWDPVNEECIIAIPADLNYDGCVTVNDLLVLLTVHGSCPPYPEWPDEPTDNTWVCGDPVTYWAYDYATVLIGDQCWFAENLRTDSFRDGSTIQGDLSDLEWQSLSVAGEGAQATNPLVPSYFDEFGRVYNWHVVDNAIGVCPVGWHVPTDSDWATLVTDVGGEQMAGLSLRSTTGWFAGVNGTNTSGFNGKPHGMRLPDGSFSCMGCIAGWWSSTSAPSYGAWMRYLYGGGEMDRVDSNEEDGHAIRCIKD
jgi:uncharacterized protein (TIGR02145 family)